MKLSEVTKEDGLALVHLLNVFKVAKFDGITGSDIEKIMEAKRWLQSLAVAAAGHLQTKDPKPAVQEPTFKVKSIGSMPGSSTSIGKKKRK